MEVSRIPTEATYDLRSRVLRPGRPIEVVHYPNDARSVHFGVLDGGQVVSVVTAHAEDSELFPGVAGQWRIRGMATDPSCQGKGVGALGLKALLDWARSEGISLVWCNARLRAVSFYARHGFTIESELFEIPDIGPHYVMKVNL